MLRLYLAALEHKTAGPFLVDPPLAVEDSGVPAQIPKLPLDSRLSLVATDFPHRNTGSGTIQEPTDRSDDTRLLRRARYGVNSRLAYTAENWEIAADPLQSSDRKDFGDITQHSYTVVNIGANYRLSPRCDLYTKVENLFDEDYELASGYNTKERIAYLGIRFH